MWQSLKAILQFITIVSLIVTGIAWVATDRPDDTTWFFRIVSPILAAFCAVIMIRASRRKETFPDLLAAEVQGYFERDGFCFGFVPIAINGICWMQIFFQNRYAKLCVGRVVFQPPREYFLGKQAPLPGIDVEITCDGGAFGVCRVPWPIPTRLQGKKTKFEVACKVSYAAGRGKLVRFREGIRVGTPGGGVSTAASGGLLLLGVIYVSRPAKITFSLPEKVGEKSPETASVYSEILFRPETAIRGFPVLPPSTR